MRVFLVPLKCLLAAFFLANQVQVEATIVASASHPSYHHFDSASHGHSSRVYAGAPVVSSWPVRMVYPHASYARPVQPTMRLPNLSYTPGLPLGRPRVAPNVESQPSIAAEPATKPINLTELCAHASPNMTVEKQLLAYVSSIEAVTGTIQELDDVVQQYRPRACEMPNFESSTSAITTDLDHRSSTPTPPTAVVSSLPDMNASSFSDPEPVTTAEPIASPATSFVEPINPTSESFLDSPTISPWAETVPRSRRDNSQETPFGMPSGPSSNNQDHVADLAKASNDLKALRKDLSRAAEWLKQTNHTVHSALLRALVTYVSSIERRIDNQRVMFLAQTRMVALKSKVAVVKEKMAALLEKLSSLIPNKNNGGGGGGGGGGNDPGSIGINRADSPPIPVAN